MDEGIGSGKRRRENVQQRKGRRIGKKSDYEIKKLSTKKNKEDRKEESRAAGRPKRFALL